MAPLGPEVMVKSSIVQALAAAGHEESRRADRDTPAVT